MVALHSFAQLQCVYFDSVSLGQLLMEPLSHNIFLQLALLYDGKIAFPSHLMVTLQVHLLLTIISGAAEALDFHIIILSINISS